MLSNKPLELLGVDVWLLITLGTFAAVILMYIAVVFLIAQLRHDNSIMDIFYGPAFAVGTWSTILLLEAVHPLTILVASLVSIWATRLALRIGRKNWGKPEDPRYAAWRAKWTAKGQVYFVLRSFLQVNLLQGIVIVIVSLPMILVISSVQQAEIVYSWWTYGGILVWATGLIMEATADWQLDSFIARKKAGTERATLMTKGLFHYSRRPNYFGESLIWWGLAIIALPLSFGWLVLLSPLLITFVLTKVTGPMLEDIFLEKYPEEYRQYMATTNYFVPWLPKQ